MQRDERVKLLAIKTTLRIARVTIAANPEMRGRWVQVSEIIAEALREATTMP